MWNHYMKELRHCKIFDIYFKIDGISLGLSTVFKKYPFHQIFVKFGNFYFKPLLAKVVDKNGALYF